MDALCSLLEDASPNDYLLPLLRRCNGKTADANVMVCPDRNPIEELVDESARRLANVLGSTGVVLRVMCEESSLQEGSVSLHDLIGLRDEIAAEIRMLAASECPIRTVQLLRESMAARPPDAELRYRLSKEVSRGKEAQRGR